MNQMTIVLDCARPAELAEFYRILTGGQVDSSDGYASLTGSIPLAFHRVDGYQAAPWPSGAKHAHLDFAVADVGVTEKELLAAGATKPEFQPGGAEWTVLADPDGHVFCLIPEGE